MNSSLTFLDPKEPGVLMRESLRLKESALQIPSYKKRWEKEGDWYFVNCTMSSRGAIITPEEVGRMTVLRDLAIAKRKHQATISE